MIFSVFSYDVTFGQMIILLLAITLVFMISLSLHEWAHGFVAYKQGDNTPKAAGRLTLNPLTHIDTWGFVIFLILGVGWAKPVPINPNNFKKYRSGIAKVSIAGIGANFILCVLGSFLYVLSIKRIGDASDILTIICFWLMISNAYLVIFNLLPIYPLDGFNFVSSFMRGDNKFVQNNIKYAGKIFMWIIIADLFFDLFLDISLIGWFLSTVASWIYLPLCKLWALIFF